MTGSGLKGRYFKEEIEKAQQAEALSCSQAKKRLEAILRWPQLKGSVNLSRVTVWRLERQGMFPRRIQLGNNSVGWIESEIMAWLESRPRVGGSAEANKK